MKEIKVGEKITLEVIAKHGVNTLVASKYVQTIKV